LLHRFTLFGTSACHLCELAEALLLASLVPGTYELYKIDIASENHLLEKYGLLIPVLELAGREQYLAWPFDQQKLLAFLAHPQ